MSDSADTHPTLLIVDDDEIFCEVLEDALKSRGYQVESAHNIADGLEKAQTLDPEYAVIDLRIGHESGLSLAAQLHARDENTRMVILTGYASIATAVEAIKLGVTHYLAKPADADEILAALHKDEGDPDVPVSSSTLSVKRLEWEHLQKVLTECDGNVSAAARKLHMHRRTLQRKLAKHPVRE